MIRAVVVVVAVLGCTILPSLALADTCQTDVYTWNPKPDVMVARNLCAAADKYGSRDQDGKRQRPVLICRHRKADPRGAQVGGVRVPKKCGKARCKPIPERWICTVRYVR